MWELFSLSLLTSLNPPTFGLTWLCWFAANKKQFSRLYIYFFKFSCDLAYFLRWNLRRYDPCPRIFGHLFFWLHSVFNGCKTQFFVAWQNGPSIKYVGSFFMFLTPPPPCRLFFYRYPSANLCHMWPIYCQRLLLTAPNVISQSHLNF